MNIYDLRKTNINKKHSYSLKYTKYHHHKETFYFNKLINFFFFRFKI